jgi:hypothetical protein
MKPLSFLALALACQALPGEATPRVGETTPRAGEAAPRRSSPGAGGFLHLLGLEVGDEGLDEGPKQVLDTQEGSRERRAGATKRLHAACKALAASGSFSGDAEGSHSELEALTRRVSLSFEM